jgi:transposase
MTRKSNIGLNSGRAKKAENKRLCRELLRKNKTQREIAKILNVSLQTANTYCQEIAREIEEIHKRKMEQAEEARRKTLDRKRSKRIAESEEADQPAEPTTPEELAKSGFTACLRELKIRLPTMTNEEVMKITVDLWDRVNK